MCSNIHSDNISLDWKKITGVPQGSILDPFCSLLGIPKGRRPQGRPSVDGWIIL